MEDVPVPWTLWEGKQQLDSIRWKVKTAGMSFKGISKGQKKGQNMIEYVFFADLFFDVFWTNNRPQ